MVLESQGTTPSDRSVTSNKHIKVSLGRRAGRIERMVVRTLGLLSITAQVMEHPTKSIHGGFLSHGGTPVIIYLNGIFHCKQSIFQWVPPFGVSPPHEKTYGVIHLLGNWDDLLAKYKGESSIQASRQQFAKKPDRNPKDFRSEGKNKHTFIKFYFDYWTRLYLYFSHSLCIIL